MSRFTALRRGAGFGPSLICLEGVFALAWESSDRKERLPSNWASLRRTVLTEAGGQCEWVVNWKGERHRCTQRATDVDHIYAGDDHSRQNLQALCGEHHRYKSSREGHWARHKRRKEIAKRFRREPEKHPGTLD